MKLGTKSVLFGAHCFFLHPFFVARAWWILNGFPLDPRLWVAFLVHDLGYIGKPNIDGPEGEKHVEFGATLMGVLFDTFPTKECRCCKASEWEHSREQLEYCLSKTDLKWHDFCLYHSRHYAKRDGAQFSKLCVADKLAFALTPKWLYLPMVIATGEIKEYLRNARFGAGKVSDRNPSEWWDTLRDYMIDWVEQYKDGGEDTWTIANRHTLLEREGLNANHG